MPGGFFRENLISICKPTRKLIYQETSCTKTCSASQACLKTQIFYQGIRKHPNISKSIRKGTREEAVCTKTKFQLENLFESIEVKRPAVRKHAMRHRHVQFKNIFYTKTYSHDVCCRQTHKYLKTYTKKY